MPSATSLLIVFLLGILPLLALLIVSMRLWAATLKLFKKEPGRLVAIAEWKPLWMCAAVFLGIYTACLLDALLIEPNLLVTQETRIHVPIAVWGQSRLKIIHLTDLHMEGMGPREESLLQRVRAEKPSVILLTGDYVNNREALPDFLKLLTELKKVARDVIGVEGHLDHKFDIAEAFRTAGALLLNDEYVRIGGSGRDLVVAGMAFHPSRPLSEILETAPADAYRIALHHSPDQARQLDSCKADLFLCGHTHGGQIWLPFLGALSESWKGDGSVPEGESRRGTAVVILNRGVGMSGGAMPRLRFMSRPEVRVIEIASP